MTTADRPPASEEPWTEHAKSHEGFMRNCPDSACLAYMTREFISLDRDALVEAVAIALSDESWQDPHVDIPLPDLLGDSILYHYARLISKDERP